jgi:hypothetical protein
VQLSAYADLGSAVWDVSVDGRWLGAGPGEHRVVDFTPFDAGGVSSARLIVVWLADGETFSLTAVRPGNAKGQDRDEISVVLPESEAKFRVFEPRLSTEYDAAGTPRRFGIELWLGEDEDGDQHPVRLAGEAPSDTPPLQDGKLAIHPMRAHRAGTDGLGLYLLVR